MIWTRIKRWLVEHPRWSLIVSGWAGLVVIWVPAAVAFAPFRAEPPRLFAFAVLVGLWLPACGACAYAIGLLTAKSGLPLRDVQRRWPWVWAGLSPLWLPLSSTVGGWIENSRIPLVSFTVGGWIKNPWILLAATLITTLAISALGVASVLAGLRLADKRAQRNLASGRWTTIAPVSPEMYDPAAAERRRINRRTIATLSVVTAAAVFGYLALLCCIFYNDMIDDGNRDKVIGWSLAALALGYIILTATIAVRRHRAGLTNTDLVLVGVLQPWLVWPVLVMGILFLDMVCEIGRWFSGGDVWLVLGIIIVFAVGSPALLAGAWLLVLLTTAAVWLIRWHRDPRYRPSAMKEFGQ